MYRNNHSQLKLHTLLIRFLPNGLTERLLTESMKCLHFENRARDKIDTMPHVL